MEQPSFDPGLTQKFSGRLRRFINKDGSFNVRRQGATWRATHPYLHLINMSWPSFLLFNALGGIVWATIYGLGGYLLGKNVQLLTGPLGIVGVALAIIITIAGLIFLKRNERRLEDEAERALPGPLDAPRSPDKREKQPAAPAETLSPSSPEKEHAAPTETTHDVMLQNEQSSKGSI